MEDAPVKSLKSAARRGGIVSAAALSALALASCSAGQVTQTSSQVAAVDGARADSEDGAIAVRDVTVIVGEEGDAALKFTAINQDDAVQTHTLESIEVDGTEVQLDNNVPLEHECSLVGASQPVIEDMPQAEEVDCISYTATSLPNDDFAVGGNLPVVFTFDSGTIELDATVDFPTPLDAGELTRGPGEGRVTEEH
ncbi:hypothetical protein [Corynebacterium halotolerans]|nr:hypothetical protein [Corynebacterium halotolerans]